MLLLAPLPCRSRGATAVQITQLNRQHDKSLERHMLHATVANALKHQLLDAVDDMFISVLRHQRLRYSQVSVLQLLQHLIATYNIVTAETLEDNRNRLAADWNPDDGMEMLYTRITNVQQFAAEAGPTHIISDATAMHLVLTALERSGMFTDACADWRKRAPDTQTLINFKLEIDLTSSESFFVMPFLLVQHLAGCPFLLQLWLSLLAKYSLLLLHSVTGVPATFCFCFWANAVPWAATGAAPLMTDCLKLFINVKAA
jgi:hypothetical protein